MTQVKGAVALVTGGARGLGKAIVAELLARGATKVYATGRDPEPSSDPRIITMPLEVTDEESVAEAASAATDVSILVNNAAVFASNSILESTIEDMRLDFDTNVFGVIYMARAFAPILAANGGGAMLNIHSVASWLANEGAYSASKAAVTSVSNSLRLELAGQGTQITGVHVGYIDTEMIAHIHDVKSDPEFVAHASVEGLEEGADEVLVDDVSRDTKAKLHLPPRVLYPELEDVEP